MLVKEDIHKALLGIEKNPTKMEDDEGNDIDFHAKATIILCSSDALYNIMNEKTTCGLWCRLENLYMRKSLSNKFFMKKQLYNFRTKEDTLILHLNAFSRILSDLLALKVKLKEEDRALFVTLFFSIKL